MQSFATTLGANYVVTLELGYGGDSGFFGGPVSVDASAAGFTGTFTSGAGTPDPAVWDLETFGFTATSSTTTLNITGKSTAGGDYIGLDNVDVEPGSVSTVPEPSTSALAFAGVGLLGWMVRRRVA